METIINSLMEKYFAILFKNFKKENLKVSLFEGLSSGQSNLTLNDLDFTEAVIQELLYIPPQLEVQSARVNTLRIMVPWSRMKTDPIVFTIDQVSVTIIEPQEVKSAPRVWSQFQEKNRKGKAEEKRDRRDILSTLKVIVKNVHIGIQTLNGSSLAVDISDLVMQSTNGEWKVVPLEQAHLVDKERKREQQFKEITARSITLQLEQGKLSHTILRDLPLRIQMTTMYSTDEKIENDLLAVSIETFLEEANFAWNQTSWKMMLNLIHGLVTCIKRPAPPAIEKKEGGTSGPENLSVGLNISGWSLELKQDGSEQGFSFFGFGLRFLVVPERHVIVPPRTEAIESSMSISVQSFTFRELVAGKDKDPRYQKLVSQAAFPGAAPDNILAFKVISRRSDKEQLSSLMALQLEFHLNGIQIVFDSEIWNNLKAFLELRADYTATGHAHAVEHVAAAAAASPVPVGGDKKDAKLDLQQLARTSTIIVEASNTVFILPNDKRNPKFTEKSLQLTIGKVGISNKPDWKIVPPLGDVAKSLPFSSEALSFVTDEHSSSYRFQAEISDVSFDLVDLQNKLDRVLAPTSVKLQTRYVKVASPAGHPIYQVEIALSWGQMDLRLTRAQYQYFHDVGQHYTDKIKAIIVAEHKDKPAASTAPVPAEGAAAPDRSAQLAHLGSQASDYIHKVAENPTTDDTAVVSQLLLKAEGNKLAAVEYGLQVFRVALLLRAEGGNFDLPLKAFGVAPERVSDELTSLKFTDLQMLFENSGNHQGVLLRMGGIGAENLDHDRIPVALSITPTGGSLHPQLYDKASNYAFHLYFVHQSNLSKKEEAKKGAHAAPTKSLPAPPPGKGPAPPAATAVVSAAEKQSASSEIGFRIGGVRVKVKRRPHAPVDPAAAAAGSTSTKPLVEELNAIVPSLKEMATGLMAKFTSHQSEVDKAKKSYDYLDIHWAVELGDAEFQLLEADGNSRGQFRVGSLSKEKISKAFTTVEDELVACKMALAQADQDREALANALDDAKQEVKTAQTAAKKDQGVLEQILIETKLKLAEAESDLMTSRAKAPAAAAPKGAKK